MEDGAVQYGDDVRGRIIAVDRTQATDSATDDLSTKDGYLSISEAKTVNGPTSQNCDSPSSDKENHSLKEEIVVNGQSEGHHTPKTGEPEHVLVVQGDPGLPAQVEQGAERVDIRCSSDQDCEESTEDEPKVEFVVAEGEH